MEDGLGSHLSKGSGRMIRFTKSSKYSEKDNKFSLLEVKEKQSKKKKEHKRKLKSTQSKPKKQSSSLSKSPHCKSPRNKDSYLMKSPKSQKSKETLTSKSPINSLKHISNPLRTNLLKHRE